MRRSVHSLFLLIAIIFASQCTWCCVAAGRGAMADAAAAAHHHRSRPRLQAHHELRAEGEKLLEVQSGTSKFGHGSTGGGAGGGGRASGGGAAITRPHGSKNGGAAALPALLTSVLAMVLTGAVLLPTFSF